MGERNTEGGVWDRMAKAKRAADAPQSGETVDLTPEQIIAFWQERMAGLDKAIAKGQCTPDRGVLTNAAHLQTMIARIRTLEVALRRVAQSRNVNCDQNHDGCDCVGDAVRAALDGGKEPK